MPRPLFIALATVGALAFALGSAPVPVTTAIVGAMVFDGTGKPAAISTVLIQGDRIVGVGENLKVPAGATIIDAHGKALTPGFYDLHTHWTPAGEPDTIPQIATEYIKSGVTTVNDFNEAPEAFAPIRTWLGTLATPHVNFAGRISTPGGHGADWADQATTRWANTPELARAAVESFIPYQPDLIKAFTDGWRYGSAPDNTSMDAWTLSALTEAAHKQHWKVLTHTVTVERGVLAAHSGVDSLAHGMQDRLLTKEEVADIAKTSMAAIPTLAVYDPNKDPKHEMIPADPKDAQRLHKFDYALQNVKMLHDAGVNIAVGTDAGMPATPHGSSTLHELELLVKAGLTPAQAIAAATSVSAKVIGQDDDRGTIAVGKRADLDLFDGKPWENIAAVHTLAMTMIDGKSVWGLNAPSLPAANGATHLEPVTAMALIDDFESENGRSSLDTLRVDTPDGGLDRTTEISEVVARDGDGHALLISAKMAMKKDAYAGVAVPLTRGSIRPADVHAFHGVRLEARGNACSDRLTLSGVSGGSWSAPLPVSTEWKTLEIPFAALASPSPRRTKPWTGTDVTQVEFGGSCKGGQKLFLQVDNVTFY